LRNIFSNKPINKANSNLLRIERDLIPYEPSLVPEGPYLIFAPHPDDETFGMGGSISLAVRMGIEVSLVVVSDGAKAGDIEIRKEETRQAASILGIENIIFWNLTDREIQGQGNIFMQKFKEEIKKLKPKVIFAPSLFEFHPDHRATTTLVWMSLKKMNYNTGLWLYEITRQGEANDLIDVTSVINLKRKAMKCYKSQLEQFPYDTVVSALNQVRSFTLLRDVHFAEAFWEVKNKKVHLSSFLSLGHYLDGLF
jgi:LmbE family N-acetylglucosaminyl deacetylase